MVRMVELFVICVILVASGNSAPWSENNDLREYDLEWQCEQLCERLFGKSIFNENNSTCSCSIDQDDPEINWKRIKTNARNMGLILEIINSHSKNIIKRETTADRLKKLIESKKQEIAALNENETVGKAVPNIENNDAPAPSAPVALSESDRIKKLKELIQSRKQAKMSPNTENELLNEEGNKAFPIKINLPINVAKAKKVEAEKNVITEIDNMKKEEISKKELKLSALERLKLKKANSEANETLKIGEKSHLNRTEMFLEKRRKLRAQLKERLLAARNRNKTPGAI